MLLICYLSINDAYCCGGKGCGSGSGCYTQRMSSYLGETMDLYPSVMEDIQAFAPFM